MFECLCCGRITDAQELDHRYAPRGEWNGRPAYEKEPCCPICGGEVEEVGAGETGA